METFVLAVILVIAVAVLARIVWRSIRRATDSSSPTCGGCPFIEECGSADAASKEECDEKKRP